jgi:hypothetical protein
MLPLDEDFEDGRQEMRREMLRESAIHVSDRKPFHDYYH